MTFNSHRRLLGEPTETRGVYCLTAMQSAAWHSKDPAERDKVRAEIRAAAKARGVSIYDVTQERLE